MLVGEKRRSDAGMKVVEYDGMKIRSPYIFVGLPDVGLVGSIAVSYMIDRVKMAEIGHVESDLLPPILLVRNGEVKNPIRLYSNASSMIALISEMPIHPSILQEFVGSIAEWFRRMDPRLVISITGVPVQNRLNIDRPKVFYISTDEQASSLMRSTQAMVFEEGIIFGAYAAILKACISRSIPTLTLFAQSHLNFPDPFASIEALDVLNKALNVGIDLNELREEAEMIRIRSRELMKQTESMLTEPRLKTAPTFYG
ncbi:MAG: PAC2 family protein [Candidatus Nitrosocaldus sp.]|nr:PAC2 family protein [Candidatus Nitrosocaldus sp.]MDW8275720.1 PAC2 family protein [Candidatus Nitrosocaldus sp.]